MGVCETNSLEHSGPSRRLIQRRPAPPPPGAPDQMSQHERRTGCALDRPDLMGAMRSRPKVGQASDQASGDGDQAGAGSSRHFAATAHPRRPGTSGPPALPASAAMPGRDQDNWIHGRGRPVTIRATLPTGHQPGPEPRRAPQTASQLRTTAPGQGHWQDRRRSRHRPARTAPRPGPGRRRGGPRAGPPGCWPGWRRRSRRRTGQGPAE
jgi:hypothetical protein